MLDLDDLMAESTGLVEKAKKAKAATKAAANGFHGMSKEEAAEANAIVKAWETEQNWTAKADIAVFRHMICACGMEQRIFSRFFRHESHKRNGSDRWVQIEATEVSDTLPRQSAVERVEVDMCGICAREFDFNPETEVPFSALTTKNGVDELIAELESKIV